MPAGALGGGGAGAGARCMPGELHLAALAVRALALGVHASVDQVSKGPGAHVGSVSMYTIPPDSLGQPPCLQTWYTLRWFAGCVATPLCYTSLLLLCCAQVLGPGAALFLHGGGADPGEDPPLATVLKECTLVAAAAAAEAAGAHNNGATGADRQPSAAVVVQQVLSGTFVCGPAPGSGRATAGGGGGDASVSEVLTALAGVAVPDSRAARGAGAGAGGAGGGAVAKQLALRSLVGSDLGQADLWQAGVAMGRACPVQLAAAQ